MIDHNLSVEEQFQQFADLENTFNKIAAKQLFETQTDVRELSDEIEDFLQPVLWDSLAGGCYYTEQDKIIFSTSYNLLLSQFFLMAGKTLFNGKYNYLGRQVIERIQACNRELDQPLKDQCSFKLSAVPFVFSPSELKDNLTEEENRIFSNLIARGLYKDSLLLWANYKNSLKIAASLSEMEEKQAQILEHSMREKLLRLADNKYHRVFFRQSHNWNLNARFLSLLVFAYIWNQGKDYLPLIEKYQQTLMALLSSDVKFNAEQILEISYAIIDACQVVYRRDYVDHIGEIISNKLIPEAHSLSNDRYKTMFMNLVNMVNQLTEASAEPPVLVTADNSVELQVVILSDDLVTAEKQKEEAWSQFDSRIKVFGVR